MPSVRRTAQVPYSAAQMFDLVNDVEAYPKFLHWCCDAHVESRDDNTVEAVLDIGISGFNKSFRTRNTLDKPNRIGIELVSGPFRRLEGGWSFRDLPDGGAEVTLSLDFEASHSPLAVLFSSVFEELARSQMAAFIERAERQYG